MTTIIGKIDANTQKEDLESKGLSIENIVGTLDLEQEFDLVELHEYLENSEYEPETHPFLVYRPDGVVGTIMIPTNGQTSLVGCKCKDQLLTLATHLIEILKEIIPGELPTPDEIEVQNIVVQGDLNQELNLPPIVVLLGMEQAEYEPEQFPGVIYRPKGPENANTVLIFGSGKYMVNGATSYSEALSTVDHLFAKFRDGGVPGDY